MLEDTSNLSIFNTGTSSCFNVQFTSASLSVTALGCIVAGLSFHSKMKFSTRQLMALLQHQQPHAKAPWDIVLLKNPTKETPDKNN